MDICENDNVVLIKMEVVKLLEISESPCSQNKCSRSDSAHDISVKDMFKYYC